MSMSDPIADMLTRIRNAGISSHADLSVPLSRMKRDIANVLVETGYLASAEVEGEAPKQELRLTLKYHDKQPVIEGLRRISKPSRRVYVGASDIPRFRGGLGTVVLSTPKGVLTGAKARELNVGGEILCYVW